MVPHFDSPFLARLQTATGFPVLMLTHLYPPWRAPPRLRTSCELLRFHSKSSLPLPRKLQENVVLTFHPLKCCFIFST